MFTAYDINKNKVSIENTKEKEKYFCPLCGCALIVKAKMAVAITPHFAHKKKEACDNFSHDMSEWHHNWQKKFPEECREVVVDNGKEKHIADVLIKNTVIEFQHSPISAIEIAKRNRFYLSAGKKVIWVFDANNQIKNKFADVLDPAYCFKYSLCWKREKAEFLFPMDKRVRVFIHYETNNSWWKQKNEVPEVLLLLEKIDPKQIVYVETKTGYSKEQYQYITPNNLVKEFRDDMDEKIKKVSTIIKEAREFQKQREQYKYDPNKIKRHY